jgi:hypothetical protein
VVSTRTAVVGVAALSASLLATGPAVATAHHPHGCPKAESLVPGAHLVTHTLAKGITVSAGTAHDPQGSVVIHVLRAQLTDKNVFVGPLLHALAQRSPLSHLAAGHRHLIAASNTGYFDFRTGAPNGPMISGELPVMISTVHQAVAGIGANGRVEGGDVWLSAKLATPTSSFRLSGINELNPPAGLSSYSRSWGSQVSFRNDSGTRPVTKNTIRAHAHNRSAIPAGGRLLVATSRAAQRWLDAVPTGTKLTTSAAVKTSAPQPFVQAYGVGTQIVKQAGQALTGFGCRSSNTTTPARTAIGYANGGRQLVIGFVNDRPGTSEHGLDEDQMSALMVQLGVSAAYAFDGSGSTELLARAKGASSLTLRTYPADGAERPMPLGLGIFSH